MKLRAFLKNAKIFLKEYSPEIAGAVGVVATLVSTGWSIYSTYKKKDILKDSLDELKEAREEMHDEDIPKEESRKDMRKAVRNVIWTFTKTYGWQVVLMTAGIVLEVKVPIALRKKNKKMALLYSAQVAEIAALKEQLTKEVGPEKAQEIFESLGERDADGNRIFRVNDKKIPDTSFWFDDSSRFHTNDPFLNAQIVLEKQGKLDAKSRKFGSITYNDIRKEFDLPPIPPELLVGDLLVFKHDPNNPAKKFDLGMYDVLGLTEDKVYYRNEDEKGRLKVDLFLQPNLDGWAFEV